MFTLLTDSHYIHRTNFYNEVLIGSQPVYIGFVSHCDQLINPYWWTINKGRG